MKSDEVRLRPAITVFHVLPSLAVGGIETMMTRFMAECPPEIDYRLIVLSSEDTTEIHLSATIREKVQYLGSSNSPLTYIRAVFKLITRRDAIIVSSTWKAALVVLLAKRFVTVARHVAFTHRSSVAHRIDRILRTWQVRHCLINIADSKSSAVWVSHATGRCDVTVMDPIFKPPAHRSPKTQNLTICFIGRLAPVKNLETVCKLVERLAAQGLSFAFHIYGPDAGSKHLVDQWIAIHQHDRGKGGPDVAYLGLVPPQDVHQVAARYNFILSCSHTEGFAMSIAEAMQVGTVPIVGKIGGPSNYCCEDNAIVLDDYTEATLENVARKVLEVWSSPARYRSMSEAAARTFLANQFFSIRYATLLKQAATMPFQSRIHA
jgi:glycosyltransferase involved in cell wall biosynthesis